MALTDDKPAKKIPCDNCDSEDVAETRCNECGIFICHYCTEFHRRSRPTKLHRLLSMDELKSSAGPENIAEKIRCTKHKEEVIKLYCKTCQATICRDCTIVDHRQHEYVFVEDVAFQEKQNLQKDLNEVKERKVRVLQGISYLREFDEGLIAKKESTISEINKHFDGLSRVVESRRKELVEKTTSLTSLKQKQIHAQLEQLEVALASCESSIEFTEQAFKNGNDVQILSMEKYISQSLQQLKKVKDQTQPCVTEDMVFCIPLSVKDTAETLFNAYAVDEVEAKPENCTASFNKPTKKMKAGEQSSITVICNDKNNRRLGFGGQFIQPTFAGVDVSDISVTHNKDGSHIVNFCPCQVGVLKFEVTINGKRAPRCSLTKGVEWVISNAHGRGPLTNNGRTMTGEDGNEEYCCRVGGCYFDSGVHTWVVRMNAVNGRGGQTEVGVIDYNEINEDMFNSKNKCVYKDFTSGMPLDMSFKLDMEKRSMYIFLKDELSHGSWFGLKVYEFTAERVSPFFACSSSGVSLSIIEVNRNGFR